MLNLVLHKDRLIRVGRRLKGAKLDSNAKNPIIIAGQSHIAMLLVRHHHELAQHQGTHFKEGSVRAGGLWITGGKHSEMRKMQMIACKN